MGRISRRWLFGRGGGTGMKWNCRGGGCMGGRGRRLSYSRTGSARAGTGDGLTDLACRLNRRGFGVLMFDFRAHGLSGGTGNSGGWHERMDILGAYDYLVSHGAERGKVGLLGGFDGGGFGGAGGG